MLAWLVRNLPLIFGFLCAFLPVLLFTIWEQRDRKIRDQSEAPPQKEKLLRPPGYSLEKKVDLLWEEFMNKILLSAAAGCFGGIFAGGALQMFFKTTSVLSGLLLLVPALALLGITARLSVRARQLLLTRRNYRLGMRGEQAVGEALVELVALGYRGFHDFPADEDWNIDHVVVGPQGVFVIETKTRRRRKVAGPQASHVVRFDAETGTLYFPAGENRKAIPQARRNAEWLADYLTKKTAELVTTEALVVLPGLFVETDKPNRCGVAAMNAKSLKGYFSGRPAKISDAQVRRIIAAVDEKCRDVEF